MNNTLLRIHIGSHFWGAGNIGDDLMLAGFLSAIKKKNTPVVLSCCSPFDLTCLRYRFPEINWFPYDEASRRHCVENCDVWLCLGGSPFQTVLSDWFLQHLADELALCQHYVKKMFFLGVGLNDYPALEHSVTYKLLEAATHVWTRDALTAQALRGVHNKNPIDVGGDLAHLFLQDYHHVKKNIPGNAGRVGFVMNFEENHLAWHRIIETILDIHGESTCTWMAQEVRTLPGSELAHYHNFPEKSRAKLTLVCPDYINSKTMDFLAPYHTISLLITSRYHSALIGAWLGCRVLLMERNLKLTGLSEQWSLQTIRANDVEKSIHQAINAAHVVEQDALLQEVNKASAACHAFLDSL